MRTIADRRLKRGDEFLRKNPIPLLLIVSLALAMISAPCLVYAESKPIVVAHLKGALEADGQLKAIMGNVTEVEWVLVLGELTSTDLTGAVMLIMVKADSSLEYTAAELSAVKSWYDTGGKTIWVAADSDYGDDRLRQESANEVLEKIGSVLRIEACSVEDPVSNAGAPYRVLGTSENCDVELKALVAGVKKAIFHGPAIITAYSGGRYYKLEDEKPEGVYKIMTTTDAGVIVNSNPPDPEIHEVGEEGNFVLMALEADPVKQNVVIATGEAPYDQYTGMYKPEIRSYQRYTVDNPQQGAKLFENIIHGSVWYAEWILTLEYQVATLGSEVSGLTSTVDGLNSEVAALEDEVESLEGDKATLEDGKTALESDVTTLEGKVSTLEGQVSSLKGSVGTWQGIAAATFVIGLVIGVAVIYMMRRQ